MDDRNNTVYREDTAIKNNLNNEIVPDILIYERAFVTTDLLANKYSHKPIK